MVEFNPKEEESIMKQMLRLLVVSLVALILISCASAPKITKVTSLVPMTDADKKMTKNGVTVEIIPINETNVQQFPELNTTATILVKGLLDSEPRPKKIPITNVLYGMTFAMKITNNTGHIIRMEGSEVGLSVGGRDVNKLDKETIKQLGQSQIAQQFPYQQTLPAEISMAIDRAPYWDERLKILPGKSKLAFVAFDVEPHEGIGQATMSIYDLVTKTDAAGNPVERTNFSFNLKEVTTEIAAKK